MCPTVPAPGFSRSRTPELHGVPICYDPSEHEERVMRLLSEWECSRLGNRVEVSDGECRLYYGDTLVAVGHAATEIGAIANALQQVIK